MDSNELCHQIFEVWTSRFQTLPRFQKVSDTWTIGDGRNFDSRWTIDVREELERSGLGLTEDEIIEVCNVAIVPEPDWETKERLGFTNWPTQQEQINTSIKYNVFRNTHFNWLTNIQTKYSMEEQILIDSIYQSMQDSARQVRRSLGRTSYATTREEALKQVEMLQQAKQAAQQTGK